MTNLNRKGRKALGTPKSHLMRKLSRKAWGRFQTFVLALPPSPKPEDIFGPVDITTLPQPKYDPRPVAKRNLEDVRNRFAGDVENHEIHLLHEDGLYRHIRLKAPGTMMYHFDLITWPGYLSIQGDMGGYTFSRVQDMFTFFRSGRDINPSYWGEKLQNGADPGGRSVQTFNVELVEEYLKERYDDWVADNEITAKDVESGMSDESELEAWINDARKAWGEVQDLLINIESEQDAHEWLSRYEGGENRIGLYDSWEWDLTDYDFHYLWCCFAIQWGIRQYDEQKNRDHDGAPNLGATG